MSESILRITGLHKRFGENEVLRNIDLDVQKGDKIAILGASGSGKSTLLRCLNFMEMPSAGRIELDGKPIGKPAKHSSPAQLQMDYAPTELSQVRRRVGMVFQQFNLFPHMTVLANVMEGLITVLKLPQSEARARSMAQLEKVGMAPKADAYPGRLSGGCWRRPKIDPAGMRLKTWTVYAMRPKLLR